MNTQYFRLHPFCYLVSEISNNCLYDTYSGRMIELTSQNTIIIKKYESNQPVESQDMDFLNELVAFNVGGFYKNPPFIEPFINDYKQLKDTMFPNNFYLARMFISLTGECNYNCIFCSKDDPLYRKTGCKRWPLSAEKSLEKEDWYNQIKSFKKLGGQEIHFIGGEPLLKKELLIDLISYSELIDINQFVIYTNGSLIDQELLAFFEEHHVKVKLQLFSLTEEANKRFCGTETEKSNYIQLIDNLLLHGLNVQLVILVSKYNENDIETMIELLNKQYSNKIKVSLEFIYPKPANLHYSIKWKEYMYNRNLSFGKVSAEKVKHLKSHNECLYGQIAVTETGDVLPCPMMRDLPLGNVKLSSLIHILNNSEYEKYAETSKNDIEKCSSCSFRYNCSDCRALERSAQNRFESLEYCLMEVIE